MTDIKYRRERDNEYRETVKLKYNSTFIMFVLVFEVPV